MPQGLVDRKILQSLLLQTHPPATTRKEAATALILLEPLDEILFMQRAIHPADPWSGQISLPGGRREATDLDLIDTARRETLEELGVELKREDFLGYLPQIAAHPRAADLSVLPAVFSLKTRPTLRPNQEVAAGFWIRQELLAGPAFRSHFEFERAGARLRLPCFEVEGRRIWGLTYQMLESFFERSKGCATA